MAQMQSCLPAASEAIRAHEYKAQIKVGVLSLDKPMEQEDAHEIFEAVETGSRISGRWTSQWSRKDAHVILQVVETGSRSVRTESE